MYNINFDSTTSIKTYTVNHSILYKIFRNCKTGKIELANLIQSICYLLKSLSNKGMLYGNLRTENILLKLNYYKDKIENIKYLSFGSLTPIEESEKMNIPN